MSPEQKQMELRKVRGISPEQIKQYLRGLGIDEGMINNIMNNNPQNNFNGEGQLPQPRKFNY